jgi:hypothetical protein
MPTRSRQDEVRAYYASLPVATRGESGALRDILLAVAPDAEETISTAFPPSKLDGRVLCTAPAGRSTRVSIH